jgi:choice-of-anchor B domain-containing protein
MLPRRSSLTSLAFPLCLGLAAGLAPFASADDDGLKRRDWQPAVEGQGLRGRPVRADEWKLAGGDFEGGGIAADFDAKGVTLLSWLPLNELPGANDSGADCWGYTSPSGREYAIMCISSGTAFVEVTDPVNPVIVGYVAGVQSLWHDATVIGEYAYACSDVYGGFGVQIIDLREIDQGIVKHVKNYQPNGLTTIHTLVSNPESKTLYACGSNIANGGLLAIDATDPENLALRSAWTTQYVHEAQVVTYTEGPYAGREIAFCFAGGPYYGYNKGFAVVDVTDKNSFEQLSLIDYPGIDFCHQGWTTPDNRYMYIDDELDGPHRGFPYPATRILDMQDLSSPKYLGYFATPGNTAIDHNQYVHNGVLYQSNYTSGFRAFDLSDPTKPFEFAFFDTFPGNNDPNYQGNWGNYPFFKSGITILSDMQRGMFVVKVDCRADLDHDGVPTFFDFLAFQNLFVAQDPAADANGDGAFDFFDFLKFQNLFADGCD